MSTDKLDDETLTRWAGCDREEAIRQAEAKHELFMEQARLFYKVRDERDAARAEVERLQALMASARDLLGGTP